MISPVDLVGSWQLERRVIDRTTGVTGRMSGKLTLARTADGVRWYERGTFIFGGRAYDSSRELLLRPRDEDGDGADGVVGGGGWTMCFADGREFHPWQPGSAVIHPCGADVYRGLVDVTATRLRTIWDVTGPAKDQRLVTRCTR